MNGEAENHSCARMEPRPVPKLGPLVVWSKYSNAHHHERNHQGKENLLLFPASDQLPQSERKVRSRERLGGLLRFYHREAA